MTHIGILCPARAGHLNPMCNLGNELTLRGYQVTFFGVPDIKKKIANSQLGFYAVGAQDFPQGSIDELDAQLSQMAGLQDISFSLNIAQKAAKMMFREAPDAIKEANIDCLLVDQVTFSGGTIADHLSLPFINVCSALPFNQEPGIPPNYTLWPYQDSWWARLRNQCGHYLMRSLTRSVWELILQQRKLWGLYPYLHREDAYSPFAQIYQLPKSLDFPRKQLPSWGHYVGSLKSPSGIEPGSDNDRDFPFEILGKKPLIYASLGTLQNKKRKIFHTIAEACLELDVQLLIDLGDPTADPSKTDFPGALVFSFPPHQKIIDRSSLVITHAGSTVINCLQAGVPMVAIPITSDQPGTAARIDRVGAGEMISLNQLNATTLKACIKKVLDESSYKKQAEKLSIEIQRSGGLTRAVDIIEQVIKTKAPVFNA